MSQALSNDTYEIARSFSKAVAKRVLRQGNEEYEELELDGDMNLEVDEWQVVWVPMFHTTAIALETLLKSSIQGSANYLLWTPPSESTAKLYTASSIERRILGPNLLQISATLRRRYTPSYATS